MKRARWTASAGAWREDSRTLRTPINAAHSHGRGRRRYPSRVTHPPAPLPTAPHASTPCRRTQTHALQPLAPTDSQRLDLKIEKLKHSPDYRDPCRWSVSAPRLARLALFISERENCVSTRYVCTFILLPFVAGFNLQRLVSVVCFTVKYNDALYGIPAMHSLLSIMSPFSALVFVGKSVTFFSEISIV